MSSFSKKTYRWYLLSVLILVALPALFLYAQEKSIEKPGSGHAVPGDFSCQPDAGIDRDHAVAAGKQRIDVEFQYFVELSDQGRDFQQDIGQSRYRDSGLIEDFMASNIANHRQGVGSGERRPAKRDRLRPIPG